MRMNTKYVNKPQVRMFCDYCGKSMVKATPLKCRGFVICSECMSQETDEFKSRFLNTGFTMPSTMWNPGNKGGK